MAFNLTCWANELPKKTNQSLRVKGKCRDPFGSDMFTSKKAEAKGVNWAEVASFSKTLGLDFESMKAFIVNQKRAAEFTKDAISEKSFGLPSDEDRTPLSPLSLATDFDIKSNGLDTKHCMDDFKQNRGERKGINNGIFWDSKHSMRLPPSFSLLDNKHDMSESKGFSNPYISTPERKEQDYRASSSGSRCTSPCLSPSLLPIGRTQDHEIGKLPDRPDFGFSDDDEDTHKPQDFVTQPSFPNPLDDALQRLKRFREWKQRNRPSFRQHAGGSVLQIDARNSIMGRKAVDKLKRQFYQKATSFKRSRDDSKGSSPKKRLKTERDVDEHQRFSESILKQFAVQIVGCPLCREPSHLRK
eukprot:1375711-Amorphochlora_amoeboformis.AAC.1